MTQPPGNESRSDQDINQGIVEMRQEAQKEGRFSGPWYAVGTMQLKPPSCLVVPAFFKRPIMLTKSIERLSSFVFILRG